MLKNWIIFSFLFLVSGFGNTAHAYDDVVSEQRDHKVVLTCPIDFKACGELHSVKWFKGSSRIAVVSGDGEVATVKDEFMSRMSIDHSPKGPATRLVIKSLQIADEDVYTCESTFLEPRESCDTSGAYRIELKIEVPPSAIHILDENGKFVKNGTKYGPLREGDTLKSICEVKGTRPVPSVAWYRGGKRLTDSLHVDESNGLFSVKSELLLVLSRLELGNNIECRVESPSLYGEIVSNHLVLDLEVRPTKINLTGVEHHTVQGTNVLLQCKVSGARPAVNIAWFNSSHVLDIRNTDLTQIETKSIEQRDGTYETISDLKFTATRFENDAKFRCEAQNIVMKDNKEKPLHESLVLEVLYPPVVAVKPDNVTVTETKQILLLCDYEANPASLVSVKWYQNGKLLNLSESKRYEGGNAEHTALLIKDSTRNDDGVYTCELGNTIGSEMSESEINVEVQFAPVVNLTMDPDTPIIENEEANVTLYCNVLEGNPSSLLKVRWFLEGDLLKELPECNSGSGNDGSDDLCNIDPSKLLLQNIGRQFLGNYSCEGLNSAGWGSRSKENELIVYYEPGNATIRHDPQIAIKKKSVSFTCSVDDPGYPKATTFHWLRGGRVVHEVTSNQYTVDPVGLDCRTNFTCYAYNAGGSGNSATVLLDVHAAPTFINPLMPYTGVLYSTGNASLTCRVECVPKCSIAWFKDGVGIENTDNYYTVENYLEADPATGDFESILSVLNFNMSAWPQGKFDIYGDNANYSCASTNNSAGPGVRSATYFGIEYPPENTTVSKDIVTVEEDNIPERILCTAKANPEPLYEWRFNGVVITRGSALIINHRMAKSDAGAYECVSYNKHGKHSAVTNITVTYKPTCEIVRKDIDDDDTLICSAVGNPPEAEFQWSIKSENDSIELGSGRIEGDTSFLALTDEFSITRVYRCVANNSVGAGPFCQIEVAVRPKRHLAWWQRWDKITLIILVASVLGVLLAVIVLCCIIVCICRRRRRRDKYHTDVSISATQSVLSYQASPPSQPPPNASPAPHRNTPEIPKSPPKWPLRPGVMVHIKGNTKQNLCANRTNVLPASSANVSLEVAQSEAQLSTLSQPLSTLIVPTRRAGNGLQVDATANVSPEESINNAVPADIRKAIHHSKRKLCSVHVGPNNNILTGEDNEDHPPPLPKRNILASRNSTNANNISECSANELLPRKRKKRKNNKNLPSDDNDDDDDSTIGGRPLQGSNDTQDLEGVGGAGAENSGLFEKIFGEIWNRQPRHDDSPTNFGNRVRNLFGMSRIFGRHRLERSDSGVSNPFAGEHRLKGIRRSGGVVTYKKTPVLKRPALDSTTTAQSPVIASRCEQNAAKQLNGKSSALGDPLTEPGEYENLPFHGLQTAPNKFVTTPSINFNNANVVRVAPRPKQVTNSQSQQQQQQHYQMQQTIKQSYPIASSQTLLLSSTSGNGGVNNNSLSKSNTTGHSRNYNLSNCFPTSYTAYYQQQQHKSPVKAPHPEHSFTNNCPYTVENETNSSSGHNPFIVQNLRKFNTNSGCRQGGHRKKPPESDKKFYSLKSLGNRKSVGLHFCAIKPSLSSNKCKRHHSFAGGSVGDIVTGGTSKTLPIIPQQNHTKMKFYEPPLYENLTDSIQIHESSVGNGRPYKQHHQHQHQPNGEVNNLMEPERLSIYRSDSGISNSSYECVTPVPAPRQLLQQKSSSHSSKCQSKSPLYMNVNGTSITPSSSLVQSNHPCPNASTLNNNNNNNGNSHCNGANKCNPTNKNSKDKQHHCQQQEMQHARHGSSNRKCKKRSQNSASLLNLERVSNTNPFLAAGASSSSGFNSINGQGGGVSSSSSSSTNRCRQKHQVLVPKDLFPVPLTPSSSSSSQSPSGVSNTIIFNQNHSTSTNTSIATNYNSDNSLTSHHDISNHRANGYVIRPMKLPLRKHHSFHFQSSQTVAGAKTKQNSGISNYKVNGGPLVFKPLLNEKSAFKPITPANGGVCNRSSRSSSNTPRICGTSLKRHMSNVESYDRNRYRIHSLSSPRLSIEDEEASGGDDIDDDDEDIDEIIVTQEEELPSSSSASTLVGTENQLNRNIVDDFDDLTINSDSEQFRRSNRIRQAPYNAYDSHANESIILATPTKRTTQYATLKFNEVNI